MNSGSGIDVVLKATPIGSLFGFTYTNSLLMTWIVMAVLIIFALIFRRKLALIPGKFQAAIEWLFEGVLDYMTETLEDPKIARRFFPLVMTIFIFIFLGNEMGFIPGVGSVGYFTNAGFVPVLRTPSADLNFTLALAIISFFTIEVTGVIILGIGKYAKRYVNFSSVPNFFVGITEILSNLARLVSFSFRLFGNIFAGEVMLLVVGFFVAYIVPVPFMIFEMFMGFIQAVVFAMLTLFFIKLAIMEPHGEEAH